MLRRRRSIEGIPASVFDLTSTVIPRTDLAPALAEHPDLRGFLDAAITRARNQSSMLAVLSLDIQPTRNAQGCSEIDCRLRQCARRSDFIAQTDPHTWLIVAEYMDGPYAAHRLAHRVLDLLEQPSELAGDRQTCSASIGIATGSGIELDAERLLWRASKAMRRAGREGGRKLIDAGISG